MHPLLEEAEDAMPEGVWRKALKADPELAFIGDRVWAIGLNMWLRDEKGLSWGERQGPLAKCQNGEFQRMIARRLDLLSVILEENPRCEGTSNGSRRVSETLEAILGAFETYGGEGGSWTGRFLEVLGNAEREAFLDTPRTVLAKAAVVYPGSDWVLVRVEGRGGGKAWRAQLVRPDGSVISEAIRANSGRAQRAAAKAALEAAAKKALSGASR